MPKYTGVHTQIRRVHEERVLRELRESGPLTRANLGQRVGLSRTTLSEITANLISRGAVVEIGHGPNEPAVGRGRPASLVALQPTVGQAMGIDFRHHEVRLAVVNASHEVIADHVRGYAESSSWTERAAAAAAATAEMTSAGGVRLGLLAGVGVGLPGPLEMGELGPGANSPRITAIRDALSQHIDAPLIFDNNTRYAALGEATVDAQHSGGDVLFLRIAHGVGGGLVLGGRLTHGAAGRAGEIGHVVVVPNGRMCRCGKRGCLETVASLPSMVISARRKSPALRDLDSLRIALSRGDPDAMAVVEAAGTAVGTALAGASVVVDPARVIVSGDTTLIGDAFLRAAQAAFDRLARVGDEQPIRIMRGRAANAEGVLGAIAAVFHESTLLQGYPALLEDVTDQREGTR
ncbi:ROK family protein [Kribbella sp. CA-294648]|uniref:ROK family transcriptional regulator n=1 Tax=Kribbella sp. CA-294648 TaxID=3239948 RepID=UPI003D8F59F9